MSSSSSSPCAACKLQRRKCTQDCIFSPYFPADQPQKFANVHHVFGASNVAKLLSKLNPAQREDTVNSLVYEAQARINDPIYGCVGYIPLLQQKLEAIKHDLFKAKRELATYIGPAALGPFLPPHQSPFPTNPFHQQLSGLGLDSAAQMQILLREQQQMETQQLAAAREQEILIRNLEQQQDIARYNQGLVDGSAFNDRTAATAMQQFNNDLF